MMADFSRVRANDYAIFYVQTSKGNFTAYIRSPVTLSLNPTVTICARNFG